jgi:hypothetical protein
MAYNAMRETIASLVRCGRKVLGLGQRAVSV